MASKNPPAAGASGGRPPYGASIFTPEFLRLYAHELKILLAVLCNPLATHLFLTLVTESEYDTGKVETSYARLIALCSEPIAERAGRRRKPPTMWQVRSALDDLQKYNCIKRNLEHNQAQGTLQISLRKRKSNKHV